MAVNTAVLDALQQRNSHAALEQPAPDAAQLDAIVRAGLRAPDHGHLRPWQFVLVEGERRAALGEVFVDSLALRDPDAAEAEINKARQAPNRAPLIIAGLLRPVDNPKVPRVEQLAAVACALHAMLLAAEAQGFAGIWRTGPYARDPLVVAALGGTADAEVVGFLYLGTPAGPAKLIPSMDPADFVTRF